MRLKRSDERRAVILMVVLALLTLFAILGITFVLYADSEATAARIARESETQQRADLDPEQALAFILGQLIYDVPDNVVGVGSGLRGHSLARTMYGYNYASGMASTGSPTITMSSTTTVFNVGDPVTVTLIANPTNVINGIITAIAPNASITLTTPWSFPTGPVTITIPRTNNVAFNGVGRLHYTYPAANPTPPALINPNTPVDDFTLVNYTFFQNDGFVRDPERFPGTVPANRGLRANQFAAQINPYTGGNVPYTYPDLNNFFLAAVKADGTVLAPSFHRPWLFNPGTTFNDMSNTKHLNWISPQGKYLTLRPRPAEHPNFPVPDDAFGDVKNLVWAPGGNDSIWIDVGAPVMTAPDGTKYKMLVAPLIVDLDGRINLNIAGNILASGNPASPLPPTVSSQTLSLPHLSNQGWGPWEISLAKVLYGNSANNGVASPGSPTIMAINAPAMNSGDVVTVVSQQPAAGGLPNILSTTISINTGTQITLNAAWPANFPPGPVTVVDHEWMNLFTGKPGGSFGVAGRYVKNLPSWTPTTLGTIATAPFAPGPLGSFPVGNPNPAGLGQLAPAGLFPHFFAPVDFDGANNGTLGAVVSPSSQATLPIVATGPALPNCFPSTWAGYLSGSATEVSNHPLLFDLFRSPLPNGIGTRVFRASEMEALLRPNSNTGLAVDSGNAGLLSDLMRLCPRNFGQSASSRRWGNLVTTLSEDLGSPGVIPYWSIAGGSLYPTNPPYPPTPPAANTSITAPPYPGAPVGNASPFPTPIVPGTPLAPTVPNSAAANTAINSEFGLDFRWLNTALGSSVLSRIKLNRPLPPYPHMGSGLIPPYGPAITGATYGTFYDTTINPAVATQFAAALTARQTLANDIYRRLLAITGVAAPANPAAPTSTELAPRRWLAQLAINIVDYIDDDDINTPFNFYSTADGLPVGSIGQTVGTNDDSKTNINNGQAEGDTGLNPVFWVFGTELPKVVLNEVLAETQINDPTQASTAGTSEIKVWVELYNTMQNPTTYPSNVQQQDGFRVPFLMTAPAGSKVTPYSPYRVSISQNLMQVGAAPLLPDTTANVLGKPNVVPANPPTTTVFPANTTDLDFTNPNGANPPNVTVYTAPNGTPGPQQANPNSPSIGAGIDPQSFFLIGPPTPAVADPNFQDPFSVAAVKTPGGVPSNIPILRTQNMVINPTWKANPPPTAPDERTTGLTVTLRRLANPYLPFNSNPATGSAYNPYITVDYIERVPLRATEGITTPVSSRGKRQPYAAWTLLTQQTAPKQPDPTLVQAISPVLDQQPNPIPPAPPGSPGGVTFNKVIVHTFGAQNFPLPSRGNQYDWLVHLDRPPISPMELLHVSGYQPYQLTQQFIVPQTNSKGDNNAAANMFKHYVPWLDRNVGGTATNGNPTITMGTTSAWWNDSPSTTGYNVGDTVIVTQNNVAGAPTVLPTTIASVTAGTSITLAAPWTGATGPVTIFDQTTPQSHRLYRLFEFLECGDRTFGVDAWGRIPGRVNINTIWDAEILQALLDANPSMGMTTFQPTPSNPTNASDPVSLIFNNMVASRTPNVTALSSTDRPFLPLSTGLNQLGIQYPNNGTAVSQDTLLRMAAVLNPALTTNAPLLLFENPNDANVTAPATFQHPYLGTQVLTKLYNNVTTRSNVFAVWLTVGFFEADPTTTPPTLGAEIGRSEGRHVRHRMFAIVDRSNLSIGQTTFTGVPQGGNPLPILVTNTTPAPQVAVTPPQQPQTVQVTFGSLLGTNPLTGATWTIGVGSTVVFEPGTDNEETVVLQQVPNQPGQLQATFFRSHLVGVPVMLRGNPGPWTTRYDPRIDTLVVPHYSIID